MKLYLLAALLFCFVQYQACSYAPAEKEDPTYWSKRSNSRDDFVDADEKAKMPSQVNDEIFDEDEEDNENDDEADEFEDEEFQDLNSDTANDPLFIPRVRIRFPSPPIRIPSPPSPRRIVRRVVRRVVRVVRVIRITPVVRFVRKYSNVKQTVSSLGGVVKNINWKNVGNKIGKYAQKTFNFLNCVIPGLSQEEACIKDAINSAVSCIKSKSNCKMSLGGKSSKCLRLSMTKFYTKSYGPFTASGRATAQLGMGLNLYMNSGKIVLDFYGHVGINAAINLNIARQVQKNWNKRIELTSPIQIFKKLIVIDVGDVPVPVMIEILATPVARINIDAQADGHFSAALTMNKDAVISLNDLQIEYEPLVGLPKLHAKVNQNFYKLKLNPSVHFTGHASLTATFQLGVELSFIVDGAPMKAFPHFQAKLMGAIYGSTVDTFIGPPITCLSGSMQASMALRLMVIPDVKSFTSVADTFDKACLLMVGTACQNPVANALNCISKKINPCNYATKGCNEIGTQLAKIPNPIHHNPVLAAFDFLTKGPWSVNLGLKKCFTGLPFSIPTGIFGK